MEDPGREAGFRHVQQLATDVHVPNFPIQPYRCYHFSGPAPRRAPLA